MSGTASRARLRAVLYARVSTDGQSVDAQLVALRRWAKARGWKVAGEHSDKTSGDPARRRGDPPGLRAAFRLVELREVDVMAVWAADRLVRSPIELLQLVARVQSVGAHVASYTDGADLDTTTETGEVLLFLRGWLARMERRLIVSRTRDGLAVARARGVRLGRPPAELDRDRLLELAEQHLSVRAIAAELGGVSRSTVHRELGRGRAVPKTGGRRGASAPTESRGLIRPSRKPSF